MLLKRGALLNHWGNTASHMVLISGGVYCLMQWCRDTSEVCSVYTMLLQGRFVHTGSSMLRRLGEFAIIY